MASFDGSIFIEKIFSDIPLLCRLLLLLNMKDVIYLEREKERGREGGRERERE